MDYKATAGKLAVTSLQTWAESYKRQLSFYAWLLKKQWATNGAVGDTTLKEVVIQLFKRQERIH